MTLSELKVSTLLVGARSSPLSQAQVKEVLQEIRIYHPLIEFKTIFLESKGDKDQATSLRQMNKTDFFTKELDELVLSNGCRIAIHSAKDLPDPIPQGIQIVALTKGLDPSDVVVLKEGVHFENLNSGAVIATSSDRREEMVKRLRNDLKFRDLRGTIHQRLKLLETGEADGVIVAEAALIRLNLTYLNRFFLPGETTPLQGKLAILAREEDQEMKELFSCIHHLSLHQSSPYQSCLDCR